MEKITEKFSHLIPEVRDLMKDGYGRHIISQMLGIKEHQARALMYHILEEEPSREAEEKESKSMRRTNQRLTDQRRINNKSIREFNRQVSFLEELVNELEKTFEENSLSELSILHDREEESCVAIVHLSDLHFNELIKEKSNKYDFDIAAKRLKLFAEEIKKHLSPFDVTEVVIAMTGDMMNSDRRLDELMSAITNRTHATFAAVDILQQFILDLNRDYNVTVSYVTGNESRVKEEISYIAKGMTDNYDTMIFHILEKIFKGADGISFVHGDAGELPIEINGSTILLMHGHGALKGNNIEKSIEQLKGRYSGYGIILDYIIFGHLHSALLSDSFSRCSSLCGSNSYNEKELNLLGKASQNIYLVFPEKRIDAIKVDLQITEGPQYKTDPDLHEYNTKSAEKKKHRDAIIVKNII